MKDYYKVLGLDSSAGSDDIKKAFRRLAREHHPDRNPGDSKAEERFKEVQEAYSVLSDPEKKKQYDQMRRNPFGQYQGGRRTQNPGSGGDPNGSFFSFDTGTGFEDLFGGAGGGVSDFFGRMFGGEQDPSTSTRTRRRSGSPGVSTAVRIPFDLALRGGKTEVTLPTGKTVRITIPKGVDDGFKIRLKGKGAATRSGATGDVFVTFRVDPHPVFRRSGNDVFLDVEVNPFEAMLGTTRNITTPYGKQVKVTIPEGSQSGDKLRLKGLGVQTDRETGDLYAIVVVHTPKDLTARQKQAVREAGEKGGWL